MTGSGSLPETDPLVRQHGTAKEMTDLGSPAGPDSAAGPAREKAKGPPRAAAAHPSESESDTS